MKNLLVICLVFTCFRLSSQTTISLPSSLDNTMYSEDVNLSNGLGDYFFSGMTASGNTRRALLRFDVSSIPSNATITAVSLTMFCSRSLGSFNFTIHEATSDWGEGTSNAPGQEGGGTTATANDATWEYNFFNTSLWTMDGGDFVSTPSTGGTVGNANSVTVADSGLIGDVQAWVQGSSLNFGWIILGDEAGSATALRFNSRHNATNPPSLDVTYTISSPCAAADTLTGIIPSGTYTYLNPLVSDGKVLTGSSVNFNAQGSVELWPNFEVELMGDLQVAVDTCQ